MEPYEQEHIAILRSLAPECMVLLKSDGSFPLPAPGRIALYGSGARRTQKGGTGSGDVNVCSFVTVEQGLENAGFTVVTKNWLDAYDAAHQAAQSQFRASLREIVAREGAGALMDCMGMVMPEPEYEIPMEVPDVPAVYVLSRLSGEGHDRSAEAGDLALTKSEIRDILRLQSLAPKFLLALNVCGVVDLSPVAEKVENILLLSQPGMTVGDSFADVLLGKSFPSGKLASTWAAWEDYNHAGTFGDPDETCYREGIYVGYRYFDSAGKTPQFPFGHGLSYTEFAWTAGALQASGSHISLPVTVTNVGARPGKEVIQLYVSVPAGKLDQPFQALAAFAKTRALAPGERDILTLTFDLKTLASFDPEDACALLERGDYLLRLGNSSRNTQAVGILRLGQDAQVQKLSHSGGDPGFVDWKPEQAMPAGAENVPVLEISSISPIHQTPPQIDPRALALAKTLTDAELAYFCVGGFQDAGSKSVIGNAAIHVMGAAGETTGILADRGVPNLVMADGPAGLRLDRDYGVDENGAYSLSGIPVADLRELVPEDIQAAMGLGTPPARNGKIYHQYCTAIPVATALAQSWSQEVCRICGDIVGREMARFHVDLWLAPALNIHRFPLCGRNFEYYSEDPLLSGKMAAAITQGVQKHPGKGVTIKHYCCNNQENNRMYNNSHVSQRALREIYLKGFEIAVREGRPAALMSSYNLLNGEHTAQREDLMETILRQEWGFDGLSMSDWVIPEMTDPGRAYPTACAQRSIRAGNDVMMPGGRQDHGNLLRALDSQAEPYGIKRENLEKCAARVIALAWKLRGTGDRG